MLSTIAYHPRERASLRTSPTGAHRQPRQIALPSRLSPGARLRAAKNECVPDAGGGLELSTHMTPMRVARRTLMKQPTSLSLGILTLVVGLAACGNETGPVLRSPGAAALRNTGLPGNPS